jgi:hypothetical protein
MILLDLSQVMIANVMVYLTRLSGASQNIDENAIRYMVLNSIRLLRSKFKESYGEMIICCDSNDVWRKDIFPHYKANRKKMRETSTVDWTSLFNVLGTIRDELGEHMPYKILQIPRAEADDIIASLCHEYGKTMRNVGENIMIVSGDKDFAQLQKYANVYQYAPVQKKNITVDNPERFLREHIMLGDRGDGVPNFLSDDDTFISDKRQKPVMRKKLDEWSILDPTLFCDDEMLRNYKRNEELINLDKIPKAIQQEVITQFATQTPSPRSKILNYFIRYRLGNLTEHIGEF